MTPLCGRCVDGWRVDPDTLLPVERCPCRMGLSGDEARDETLTAVAGAHPGAFEAALRVIKDVAHSRAEFSANDTRNAMDLAMVPGPTVGAAFRAAQKRGWIRRVGYEPSTDAATKSHPIARYTSLVRSGQRVLELGDAS